MKIWQLTADDESKKLTYDKKKAKELGHPIRTEFNGSPIKESWMPIKFITLKNGKYVDFPNFRDGVPVCTRETFVKIGYEIGYQAEFLPVAHEELDLLLVNVTNIIDCVNSDKSTAKRLSTGAFICYLNHVFLPEKIPNDTLIFKLPETSETDVYVTDLFVNLVKKHKLKGCRFIELWDSEQTDEMETEKQITSQFTLEQIEKDKGTEFSYEVAVTKVLSGIAVASGKWKMQLDSKGRFWLGQLGEDAQYHWLMPVYMPPILLEYDWHEVGKSTI
ncbi:imm11 family protein [Cohnella herbarum]|uniref:Uncharacterized protein n=1 Tax=Cohnella herbarum TaxID=2728023 RepID=A0A7Z2VGC3_9BACL|nr:hypothetical protein [Cohnella herbarum]QJD82592.1 hypothetical protein HH215_04885 [Cohnella herbarum]